MFNLNAIVKQLEVERDRIDSVIQALRSLGMKPTALPKRRTMSAAARRRIAVAQKARWAKWRRANK
jgi:hypothetical protein